MEFTIKNFEDEVLFKSNSLDDYEDVGVCWIFFGICSFYRN
jgi:hypothetical protein